MYRIEEEFSPARELGDKVNDLSTRAGVPLSNLLVSCKIDVKKDYNCNQEEAVGSLKVAGNVVDLQHMQVEYCRYRSESYQ